MEAQSKEIAQIKLKMEALQTERDLLQEQLNVKGALVNKLREEVKFLSAL